MSRCTGKLHWVQLDAGTNDNDHFIDPEERIRVAMARAVGARTAKEHPRLLAAGPSEGLKRPAI
ncbi:MAG TPA: hypothetical protein VLS86_02390 [Acidimicrobiia bacterium]|nr:hypothetical protein [Acidimicrobiia bacterium]